MRYPDIVNADYLVKHGTECSACINGNYVAARAEGFASWRYRLKATWLVFTGKADALTWTGQ
jgi:hypothetical protein